MTSTPSPVRLFRYHIRNPRIYWLACLPHMRFGKLPGGASLARAYTIGA
ncbi:hypothetical protein I0858_12630 [Raoultella ornithinolytica]|nr:hypothetical protein [Raoultella ornithinolytica]QPG38285.1 hypothetical protein I0858_12630 [Raoultella ornithinolytica]